MPLVAFSVCLDRIEENLLYQAPNGSWWLGCVCTFDTDNKGRTIVAQSIPKERYAAGAKGPQVGYWREIGGKDKPASQGSKGFDLAKYQTPAQPKPPDGKYPTGQETLFPSPQAAFDAAREPQREPQADNPQSCVCQVQQKGDLVAVEKGMRLIHKRPEGEVAAARAPEGKSSGAGAQPL